MFADGMYAGYAVRRKKSVYAEDNFLMHFGIKGQRWGIRRFQNEDRSLTEEGKRRYGIGLGRKHADSSDESANSRAIRNKKDAKSRSDEDRAKVARSLERRMKEAWKKQDEANTAFMNADYTDSDGSYSRAYLNKRQADKAVKDLKLLQKINQQKHISQHRLNLEAKYVEKGFTEDEAKVKAYRRERNEKIAAVATVTTLAVAAAWLHKNHMADIDKIIPKDMLVQNLSADPNRSIDKPFFASYDPADNRKYIRLFGGDHMQRAANNPIAKLLGVSSSPVDVQKMTAQAMSEMKIAGANVGRETASELLRTDRGYREALKGVFDNHGVGSNKNLGLLMEMNGLGGYRNLQDAVYQGKPLNKQGYNFLNRILVDHTASGEEASSKLFAALRKKGYDGTIDLNDVFNSGYDAKSPVVIFNGGSKLGNVKRATIDPKTLKVGAEFEKAKAYVKQLLNLGVPIAATAKVSEIASDAYKKRRAEKRAILNYKQEHPNTQLTDREILKNVLDRS